MRKSRTVNSAKLLVRLEKKHESLKARVRELEGQPWLSTAQQVERNQLKKRKLAAKDAMEELRAVP